MFRTTVEWHLLFFAKFRSHLVKNKKVMTKTSSQLNAPVLMTEPFNLGKRLRNERRNSIPMTRHYPDLGRAGSNGWKFASSNQKHYPDLGRDASSAWNFSARFSDVISREKPVTSRNVGCFIALNLGAVLKNSTPEKFTNSWVEIIEFEIIQ